MMLVNLLQIFPRVTPRHDNVLPGVASAVVPALAPSFCGLNLAYTWAAVIHSPCY